jgi:hypothetical protein
MSPQPLFRSDLDWDRETPISEAIEYSVGEVNDCIGPEADNSERNRIRSGAVYRASR